MLRKDRYAYVNNNPVKYTDPSGHWIETAFDVISLGLSLNDVRTQGLNFWTGLAVVTDVASIVLPVVPAGASHAIRAAKWGANAANAADSLADSTKAVYAADNLADALDASLYALGTASGPRVPRIEGYNLKPGQQPDIYIDANGLVIPEQGGASTFETVEQLNAQGLSGNVWELPGGSATPGFDNIPDGIPFGSQPLGHHSLVPNSAVLPGDLVDNFNKLPWKPVFGPNGKPLKLPIPQ